MPKKKAEAPPAIAAAPATPKPPRRNPRIAELEQEVGDLTKKLAFAEEVASTRSRALSEARDRATVLQARLEALAVATPSIPYSGALTIIRAPGGFSAFIEIDKDLLPENAAAVAGSPEALVRQVDAWARKPAPYKPTA